MKNIVVLGDIRLHLLIPPKGFQTKLDIIGGATLMQTAIEQCFSRNVSLSSPRLYSYDFELLDYDEFQDSKREEVYRWEVARKFMRGTHFNRYCVSDLEPKGVVYLPPPSQFLIEALGNEKGFPRSESRVPDIVVFDDLGLKVGDLLFPCDTIAHDQYKQEVSLAVDARVQKIKALRDAEEKFNTTKSNPNIDELTNDRSEKQLRIARIECETQCNFIQKLTLQRLFTVLKERAGIVGSTGHSYPAEPVMILSTAGRIPQLPKSGELLTDLLSPVDGRTENIWQQIYKCEALRRRTVVIFDADTIRKEISVSAGLSWERTAQETITEFKRCHELRGFLDFGIVVVRFGITGLLTIINEGNGKWSHTLYFNPEQDDASWSHRSEGEVLGTTSVLVATICEELDKVCRYRNGSPILQDIKVALDRALLVALNRILNHHEYGYGTNKNEFYDEIDGAFSESFPSRTEVMERNIRSSESVENPTKLSATLIQKIQFSPFRSRYWSILSQSCQADINDVAQNIVLYGPNLTLNTMEDSAEVFAELWLEETLELVFYPEIRSMNEFDKDEVSVFEFHELSVFESADDLERLSFYLVKCLERLHGGGRNALRNVIGLRPFSALGTLKAKLEGATDALRDELEKLLDSVKREILFELSELESLKPEPATPEPATPEPATPEPATPEPATPEPVTPEPVTPELATIDLATIDLATIDLATIDLVAPELAIPELATLELATLELATLELATPELVAPELVAHELVALGQVLPESVSPKPVSPKPVSPKPVTPEPVTPELAAFDGELNRVETTVLNRDWDDLYNNLDNFNVNRNEWDIRWRTRLLNFLVDLCKRSTDIQVWSNSISSPVLWLGQYPLEGKPDKRLLVIDRKEVEGIRAVKRMVEQYLSDVKEQKADRPLSIAVFGPPGAGKSVAVNKIIEMVGGSETKTQIKVINLSTLSGFDSFDRQFQEIVKELASQKSEIPVIFFDEFDASVAGKPYGWLKFFLSMMEDGKPLKEAIFIFAGGTADTFESFSMTDQTRSDEKWAEFCLQKGPDFISRLKGHINVVGVNPASPEDDLYLIRRALILRFLVSQAQGLKEGDKAQIDQNMLNAFLHVPRYIHGSRSMRMLVDLCVKRDGKTIAMSEVPPIHQLDMQVDGKAFSALASGQTSPELRHSEKP